ncbi:MAG: hypothetical protein ACP5HJ_03540 [Candidatus Micrarchaeia archaeon]|jgi:hypothetical protein
MEVEDFNVKKVRMVIIGPPRNSLRNQNSLPCLDEPGRGKELNDFEKKNILEHLASSKIDNISVIFSAYFNGAGRIIFTLK